jgi:DNA replication and repair protein RecF
VYLRQLHLRHFRNYTDQWVEFQSPKTILVGDNAQGKTNLLEAVELLATLQSHRATRDRELVQSSQPIARIAAVVERHGTPHDLTIDLRVQGRRSARVDGQLVRRRPDFLGQVNAVAFSSLDLELVRGGPTTRRHWLNDILMQLEPLYADVLDQYRQVLKQRNALLKEPAECDVGSLAAWNAQLVVAGTRVMRRRSRLIQRLSPLAADWHRRISGDRECLALVYWPQVPLPEPDATAEVVQQKFWQEIEAKAGAERVRGTSLVGPHRDEVQLTIDDTAAREYGSQGQQRTLVLALKLAELQLIEQVVGDVPLLLLDDVLAELDLQRQDRLLDAIGDRVQTLVTTTHLGNFDASWLQSAQILRVVLGCLQRD